MGAGTQGKVIAALAIVAVLAGGASAAVITTERPGTPASAELVPEVAAAPVGQSDPVPSDGGTGETPMQNGEPMPRQENMENGGTTQEELQQSLLENSSKASLIGRVFDGPQWQLDESMPGLTATASPGIEPVNHVFANESHMLGLGFVAGAALARNRARWEERNHRKRNRPVQLEN